MSVRVAQPYDDRAMCRAMRSASAMIVSVGLKPPEEGNTEPSAT